MKKDIDFSIKKAYDYPMLTYKGYITHSLGEAAQLYKAKTGNEPTVLLIREDFLVTDNHPAAIRSHLGAWGIVLASHLLTGQEIQHLKMHSATVLSPAVDDSRQNLQDCDVQAHTPAIYKKPTGRPKRGGNSQCPHCKQHILNFDDLGWWYGWSQGIEPPYWEELRLYVFQRDKFTCQTCHKQFGMSGLTCHHRVPKEEGGSDSAKNLVTLCNDCHPDDKPIMPEDED